MPKIIYQRENGSQEVLDVVRVSHMASPQNIVWNSSVDPELEIKSEHLGGYVRHFEDGETWVEYDEKTFKAFKKSLGLRKYREFQRKWAKALGEK